MLKDRKVKKEKIRKSSRTAKPARLTRRIKSLIHEESKFRKEGVTYEFGMGLKDASNSIGKENGSGIEREGNGEEGRKDIESKSSDKENKKGH